ncbi:MAG TPA: HEAT repeat domain-containing protein, partial [Pirellulaceae bacterium]|nr:HEAT repeat domain-containing protein [Pirellulaceae bacterium]
MSASQADFPAKPPKPPPGEMLPPVEAPTGTFILQLFLIPLLIVTIVVVLWLSFGWLAQMGRDNPDALVKSIERGDNASWQRAYELADLLRSPDPRYDAVRRDNALAERLADFLQRDMQEPAQGKEDQSRVIRRMYLCRALGGFEVLGGLQALMQAAEQERDPVEVEVRYSAIEAIATLAHNCGPEILQNDKAVIDVLLKASREQDDASTPPTLAADGSEVLFRPHAELRAVAAYALGVIGGEDARDRLQKMLIDGYPNARYNAATGLARHGDIACEGVLREMLDPDQDLAVRDERYDREKDRKRATVLLNGIKATLTLAEANPEADLT